jgi:large subunit ribosomal protein L13
VNYTPHIDCGDYVIIKNANHVKVSANKPINEFRYSHSGYIGGLRKRSVQEMLDKYADELIYLAVKGMVPKNRLGRQILTKLKVYKDQGNDHSAQKPVIYKVK